MIPQHRDGLFLFWFLSTDRCLRGGQVLDGSQRTHLMWQLIDVCGGDKSYVAAGPSNLIGIGLSRFAKGRK